MYKSFYNLTDKPFQLSTDPGFFFGSRGHKRALSYLQYGITQGEGFIVITGDIGTGKTMLVQTLFSELDKENIVAAQIVTTQLEADDTLRVAAAAFGLAHEGLSKASLLKNLETFLIARTREGKRVLLVVDEAQNLPIQSLEELRMLSNFQTGGRALLQSFLLGQQQFRRTLQSDKLEQLRQRVIAAYHLTPIDRDEIQGYIEHRLKQAGWKGDPVFTDAAYDAIHLNTDGVPRRINTLCDRLMLYGYLEEQHEFTEQTVNIVKGELLEEMAPPPESDKNDAKQMDTTPPFEDIKPDSKNINIKEKPIQTAQKTAATVKKKQSVASAIDDRTKVAAKEKKSASSEDNVALSKPSKLSIKIADIDCRLLAIEERVSELEAAFKLRQSLLRRVLLANEGKEEL